MAVKSYLVSLKDGQELQTYMGVDGTTCLGVMTFGEANGHWNSESRSGAGTTNLIAARSKDAITLTDLIITTDKVNLATVSVIVTDGSQTETLAAADVTNAPCNIALSFSGRWETWQATRVDMVTTGAVAATVSIGYYRVPEEIARTYAVWNAER